MKTSYRDLKIEDKVILNISKVCDGGYHIDAGTPLVIMKFISNGSKSYYRYKLVCKTLDDKGYNLTLFDYEVTPPNYKPH